MATPCPKQQPPHLGGSALRAAVVGTEARRNRTLSQPRNAAGLGSKQDGHVLSRRSSPGRDRNVSRSKKAAQSFRFFLRLLQQRSNIGPQLAPLLAFLFEQSGQGCLAAYAGQVRVVLPVRQLL